MRELAEEAGLRVKPKHLSKLSCVAGGKNHKNLAERELHYYLLTVAREVVPKLNREHSCYRWFKRNHLPANFNLPTTVAIKQGLLKSVKS